MRYLSSLLILFVLLFGVSSASAHRPLWGEDQAITEIPNLDTSFAVYRDLRAPEQVDVYVFEAQAGERLHAGINIPAVAGLEQYGVSVALMGPGLPAADPALLPAAYPPDLGAQIFSTAPGEDFFEPFTQTNYWGRQRLELNLPETGTYYLLVWNPAGQAGKYVMDTGTAEVFGPADLFRFPVWWVQVHLFFGHGPYLAAGALALVAALAGAGAWRLRLRPTTAQPNLTLETI